MSKCTCVRPEAILNGVCANCEFPVTPKPEAPDVQKLIANGEHACQTGDCGHGRGYECEAQLAQDAKPAKDAGAREWPTEMLKNLDASLKLQSMLAAPDHAWIGPSVIEVATAAYEKLAGELENLKAWCANEGSKHQAVVEKLERELAEAKAYGKLWNERAILIGEKYDTLNDKSAALVEVMHNIVNGGPHWAQDKACEALAKWGKG